MTPSSTTPPTTQPSTDLPATPKARATAKSGSSRGMIRPPAAEAEASARARAKAAAEPEKKKKERPRSAAQVAIDGSAGKLKLCKVQIQRERVTIVREHVDGEDTTEERRISSAGPHPDLPAAMNALAAPIAKLMGLPGLAKQTPKVTGVTLHRKDPKTARVTGLSVTLQYKAKLRSAVVINAPLVHADEISDGLWELLVRLQDEAMAFAGGGKRGQVEMPMQAV